MARSDKVDSSIPGSKKHDENAEDEARASGADSPIPEGHHEVQDENAEDGAGDGRTDSQFKRGPTRKCCMMRMPEMGQRMTGHV